jgi:hypothetical protein
VRKKKNVRWIALDYDMMTDNAMQMKEYLEKLRTAPPSM